MTHEHLLSDAKKEGISRLVVGGVVSDGMKILLLRRKQDDFMGGILEIPSGKVEEGETLSSALTREVKEETGLDISSIGRYLGHFDYLSKSGRKTRQFNFMVEVKRPFNVVLTEHDEYKWLTPDEAKEKVTGELKGIISLVS